MTGRTVGNYKLVEKLGQGGMGAVYKGVDLMVEREVAIKMLRPEIAGQPELVERFRAEAVALARLNHPNIATLYSFFREGDEYFMVMEFVLGRTLEALLRGAPPMAIEPAIALASQVLDAIEHAHSLGILHRDIKPANIMLTASGQAKVTDFGIARVLGTTRMTREGSVCGTLQYLAPERIRGQEADLRSDLYSMGVVLYEMLTSRLPFERDNEYALMRAHLEETPPPFASWGLSSIPPQLETAVAKSLAKLPEHRFATAAEFRLALAGAQARPTVEPAWSAAEPARSAPFLPVAAPAPTLTVAASNGTPAVPATRRWKLPAAVAAVLVLIGLMAALYWNSKGRAAEAMKPSPAPAVTQPSTPPVQPQAGGPPGSVPESAPAAAEAEKILTNAPVNQGPAAGSPANSAGKAKSPPKTAPELERRKAALKALGKDANTDGKKTDKDRRSSALEALKQ